MTEPSEQIAIVGLGCRYPDADNPAELWQTVLGRRRAFRAIPPGRLEPEYRFGAPDDPDSTYVRRAGVLRDWRFDRERFRISGTTYRAADQTHWLALETAAAALTDAGFPGGDGLDRDRVGVVLGNSLTGEFSRSNLLRLRWPFLRRSIDTALRESRVDGETAAAVLEQARQLLTRPFPEPGDESLAGGLSNTIAGRICNHFDFHGTGYTVDGACASSLLAVITACNALAAGELSFALAGGVDLSLDPFEMIGFARLGALAHDDMRVYDQQPTGFLPGEGCGILALMRVEDAKRRNLRIYARLTGWASSSDGAGGLTRPEASGQSLALLRAYRAARVDPGDLTLIEGHGTGTAVGDQVELESLTAVRPSAAMPAALGSIKANIGHTKAAAGAAALIKVALAAFHRVLPPTTGCSDPHPLLRGAEARLRVLDEPEPWDVERPRAGVTAAGFGGINTHVVVEGELSSRSGRRSRLPVRLARWAAPVPVDDIVLIEAADVPELSERLTGLTNWAGQLSVAEVHDLAGTLAGQATGTAPLRCALVAAGPLELAAAAGHALRLIPTWTGGPLVDEAAGVALGGGRPARIGLLLPGQAAPVRADPGPLGRLLTNPPPRPASLVPATVGADPLLDTVVAQPAVVWQSLAGLAWLEALGCTPVAALGHSLGELTALTWAGALDSVEVLRLAAERGRIMAEHGIAGTGMLSVPLARPEAERLAEAYDLVVAAVNGPEHTVLAGPDAALARLVSATGGAGIGTARLPVSHGFHSPAMAPAVPAWAATLRTATFQPIRRTVISTVTGQRLSSPNDLPDVLARQFTEPVLFLPALRELAQQCDLLVEAGPGTMLSTLAGRFAPIPAVSLDCAGAPRKLALATAALAAAGAADLGAWFAGRAHRPVRPGQPMSFLLNPAGLGVSPGEVAGDGPLERPAPVPTSAPVPVPASVPVPVAVPASAPVPVVAATDAAALDPLDSLRAYLAEASELPVDAIAPSSRFLSDLHLNSLQVSRAVAAVAVAIGRRPPAAPLALADVTVAEAATLLGELPLGVEAGTDPVLGVAPWVRTFRHEWVEHRLAGPAEPLPWQVDADPTHPLHRLADGAEPTPAITGDPASVTAEVGVDEPDRPVGLAVGLRRDDGPERIAELLSRIGHRPPDRLLIVHDGHPAAAALGRSAAAEIAGCAVTVVELADDQLDEVAALTAGSGYLELRLRAGQPAQRAVTVLHRPAAGEPSRAGLQPGEVCLVTGGAAGITGACAAELAEQTGCQLVVLGRRAADSAEVADGLARLRTVAGADRVHYLRCDLADPVAVRAAVAEAARIGPVRGLLHGAGTNVPQPMAQVSTDTVRQHLTGKVDGLLALLRVAGDELRLVVAFGSVIGRQGLTGQSAYCVANDWMRLELERWAEHHPGRRVHVLEWSVWSGLGMGVRLDVLDQLRRSGVAPISPAQGTALFRTVLQDPDAPVTLFCTAAFPASAALAPVPAPEAADPADLRFTEVLRARVGQVETVAEAVLSAGSDLYLPDHQVSGVPLLPAVLGLEAMAQVAAVTSGRRSTWTIRDAQFPAPVTVAERSTRTLRIAALAEAAERPDVRVTLRDDSDRFATDRFTGTVVGAAEPVGQPARLAEPIPADRRTGPHPWYGTVLFHQGRMRRLAGVDLVSAFTVRAWIDADRDERWFAEFLGRELLLGDPAGHDASIHTLLGCAPHRRVLPVGAAEFSVWRVPHGRLAVRATERAHTADEYVFDVDVLEPGGPLVARWRGLRLRAIGANPEFDAARKQGRLPNELLGPWLTRRLIESGTVDAVELFLAPGDRSEGAARQVLADRLGVPVAAIGHDPAGGLRVPGRHASAAYTAGQVLVALADQPVGIDWQEVPSPGEPGDRWLGLLGPAGPSTAQGLAGRTGEDFDLAATRLWAAREAMTKLGVDPDRVMRVATVEPDGLVIETCAEVTVATAVGWAVGRRPVVVAVAVQPEGA